MRLEGWLVTLLSGLSLFPECNGGVLESWRQKGTLDESVWLLCGEESCFPVTSHSKDTQLRDSCTNPARNHGMLGTVIAVEMEIPGVLPHALGAEKQRSDRLMGRLLCIDIQQR